MIVNRAKIKEKVKKYVSERKIDLIIIFIPLLISAILVIFYLWPLYKEYITLKNTVEYKKTLISEYQQRIKKIGKIEKVSNEYYKYLFRGRDPYVIVSNIQKKFEQIEQITVRSFRITNQKDFVGKLKKVSIYFNIQGDIKGLVAMLNILENIPKALTIKRLNLSRLVIRGEDRLQINLTLEAIFLPEQ